MKPANITIDDISFIIDSAEPKPFEPADEFEAELAQFDDPEAEKKELIDYSVATFEIKLTPKLSVSLVVAVNEYLEALYELRAELASFENEPTVERVSNVSYLAEKITRARREIAKIYNRAGDFNARQLDDITGRIVVGIDKLNRNEGKNGNA